MTIVGIVRERREPEDRVAASADVVKRYRAQGLEVLVEKGAGAGSAISDEEFAQAGAEVVPDAARVFARADVILKVQGPTAQEIGRLRAGQLLVGMLDPHQRRKEVAALAERGVTAFALELLPRTTRAQAMDVLSSQANLAGYRAVVEAMAAYARVVPMMMTAAGTIPAAKVFVVGAGVAGLQAIATARRMGAVVTATDVRPQAKGEIESLGAKFVGYIPEDAATAGGYARPLTPEEQKRQAEVLADHIRSQDIVITTAQVPGRKAPRIVTKEMVRSMKPGSVLLDLAVESGGNIEGSRADKVVSVDGVRILGPRNLPSRVAPTASALYARNLFNFLALLFPEGSEGPRIDTEDELIRSTLLTHEGRVVHPDFQAGNGA